MSHIQRLAPALAGLWIALSALACSHRPSMEEEALRYIDSLIVVKYGEERPASATHLIFINENNGVCNDCAIECLKFVVTSSRREDLYYYVTLREDYSLLPPEWLDRLGPRGVVRRANDRYLLTDPTSGLAYMRVDGQRLDTIIRIPSPPQETLRAIEELMDSE